MAPRVIFLHAANPQRFPDAPAVDSARPRSAAGCGGGARRRCCRRCRRARRRPRHRPRSGRWRCRGCRYGPHRCECERGGGFGLRPGWRYRRGGTHSRRDCQQLHGTDRRCRTRHVRCGDKRTPLERTIEARERFRERLGELSREQRQVEGPWLEGLINDATDKIKRLRAEEKANPGDGDLPTVGAFITAEQPTPAGTFTLPASAPTLATRAGGEPCPAEAAATTPGSSTVAAIAAGACVAGAIAMLALQQLGRRCCRSGGRPEIKRGSQMPQPPFSA